ncbi:MAG: DUF1269 domain-containing protein [Clostridia bacterium]|nr:DUF1269 domain-containing protein [Clostridia bacterium]
MSKTIVAIFDTYRNAETAANQIKDQGLRTADISIVAKERDAGNAGNAGTTATMGGIGTTGAAGTAGNTTGTMGTTARAANDNISDGVVTGGILGGLAGLLIGAGSMMIPGLGIIAAAGPITGLLSGAVTGGIVGGLIDLGIPENRSKQYETDIKAGKILFSMKTDDDKVEQIGSILRSNGATSIDSY